MTTYTHRYLARFVIEAATPLAVGNGEKDVYSDALVAKDVNGLPYIPASAIAGVLRHSLSDFNEEKSVFGFQKDDKGKGSEIIFSDAKILNSKKEVIDGLCTEALSDDLLTEYEHLPIRQHAKITHRGVTEDKGKFDEEVCFAGTRFCFEIEMVSDGTNYKEFEKVLGKIKSQTFRLGSGTRCGFGELAIIDFQSKDLDLSDSKSLDEYLAKSSFLNSVGFWDGNEKSCKAETDENYIKYRLGLTPQDFFMFGSGFGDEQADMTPQKGYKVDWESGFGKLEKNMVLIPSTSVKGALSHRVAFHYNKKKGVFADQGIDFEKVVGKNNKAVCDLFGSEGEKDPNNKYKLINQKPGSVLVSDIIENRQVDEKILNHVAIDRFTGGAIQGALFSEKTSYVIDKDKPFVMTFLVKKTVLDDPEVKYALEEALKDICKGLLPLGGGTNRGNGVFEGDLFDNENNELYKTQRK